MQGYCLLFAYITIVAIAFLSFFPPADFIPSSHLQDILCHQSVVLMRAHRQNLLFQCLAGEQSVSHQGALKHLVHWEHRIYKTQTKHQQQSLLFSVRKWEKEQKLTLRSDKFSDCGINAEILFLLTTMTGPSIQLRIQHKIHEKLIHKCVTTYLFVVFLIMKCT